MHASRGIWTEAYHDGQAIVIRYDDAGTFAQDHPWEKLHDLTLVRAIATNDGTATTAVGILGPGRNVREVHV